MSCPNVVVGRGRAPVSSEVEVERTGVDGDLVPDNRVRLRQPPLDDRRRLNARELRQGLQQMNVRVHRLEPVVRPQPVESLGERPGIIPREDRLALTRECLKISAVLRVVGIFLEPLEGISRDLERSRSSRVTS